MADRAGNVAWVAVVYQKKSNRAMLARDAMSKSLFVHVMWVWAGTVSPELGLRHQKKLSVRPRSRRNAARRPCHAWSALFSRAKPPHSPAGSTRDGHKRRKPT